MFEITTGKIGGAQKVVLYGPEGIGKSTFASKFPDPLFIDTEGSTKFLDVRRLPRPTSWEMMKKQIDFVIKEKPCSTLVIDTADWAETLAKQDVMVKNNWTSIEDPGYGKGFTVLAEEWGRFLNRLSDVTEAGINVVLTAHAMMRKFEEPDTLGSYDRWELKLERKTAAITKEWADMVLFANYKTVILTKKEGMNESKAATGGKRVMYTTHHPAWDAKNRVGLPEELDLDYLAIAEHFKDTEREAPKVEKPREKPEEVETAPQEKKEEVSLKEKVEEKLGIEVEVVTKEENPFPKALQDLMKAEKVTVENIMELTYRKGFYPRGTEPEALDADYVNSMVSNWEKISKSLWDEGILIPF